jgi:hypothetical protein
VALPNVRAIVGVDRLEVVLEARALGAIVAKEQAQVLASIENLAAQQVVFPAARMPELLGLAEQSLALLQRLARALAVFDIHQDAVPALNIPLRVA